jgi:hypothetical protein
MLMPRGMSISVLDTYAAGAAGSSSANMHNRFMMIYDTRCLLQYQLTTQCNISHRCTAQHGAVSARQCRAAGCCA